MILDFKNDIRLHATANNPAGVTATIYYHGKPASANTIAHRFGALTTTDRIVLQRFAQPGPAAITPLQYAYLIEVLTKCKKPSTNQ